MTSLSGLGLGLSLVFGCLLLALVAELFYLLCWKKRINIREIEDEYINNFSKQPFQFNCFKKPTSFKISNPQEKQKANSSCHESDLEMGSSKDVLLQTLGEESVEAELMRLHNLAGPPRFLFTIKEETKEDLDSEDGKSHRSKKGSRTRSLSDLILTVDTPFLTPLASPTLKSSPLRSLDTYKLGFNPLFELSTENDLNRLRSSPPPKFKFLRDAEEKLLRRLLEEAEKRASQNATILSVSEEKDGSFITFMVGKKKENEFNQNLPQHPSSSSQVVPLSSSPTMFRTLDKKSSVH